ncbi:hypothetical protein, partial [Xanthovirga aplysinae]|uniref:hypothetical protein n=1 Tax=Xanthovirga aplysinae TaxID=2529853 RepID=UPI0016572E88
PFKDSTTYTFNFRDAVTDITEYNKAENVRLAFSTGPYLDSLQVKGVIRDLLTNEPIKEAIVSLYPANDTLDLFNSEPNYFTMSGEDGSYLIDNIKDGDYRIYAFSTKSRNLTAKTANDIYGFSAKTLDLKAKSDTINIGLVKNNIDSLKLLYARPSGKYFEIRLNKYVTDYSLEPIDSDAKLFSNLQDENKTIRVYNTDERIEADSMQVKLWAIDSVKNKVNENLYIKFIESRQSLADFAQTAKSKQSDIIDTIEIKYTFNKPIKTIVPDSLYIQYDSLTIDPIDVNKDLHWNKTRDQVTIVKAIDLSKVKREEEQLPINNTDSTLNQIDQNVDQNVENLAEEKDKQPARLSRRERKEAEQVKPKPKKINYVDRVRLYNSAASFISIENDSSTVVDNFYTFKEPKNFGIIKGKITTTYPHYYVQLLDDKNQVIDEQVSPKNYEFNYVKPGTYKIRVLVANKNTGKWEIGDIRNNEEPDPVYFYPKNLTVRANWELLEDLTF